MVMPTVRNNMQITDYDALTNETIVRDANDDELKNFEIMAKSKLKQEAEAEANATAKAALLAKLGITAEEAALLLS